MGLARRRGAKKVLLDIEALELVRHPEKIVGKAGAALGNRIKVKLAEVQSN